jgi:hypothetical protein
MAGDGFAGTGVRLTAEDFLRELRTVGDLTKPGDPRRGTV